MTVLKQWFNSLSEKEQILIIQSAYMVNRIEEPDGYSETITYLMSCRNGNLINTHRIYREINVPNYNEESCVSYFCEQFEAKSEKTYAHSSNGGNWNGWKIYLK